MRKYRYFVSFIHLLGLTPVPGNAEIFRDKPVFNMEDVRVLQTTIETEFKVQCPIITHFQLFEEPNDLSKLN